MHIHTLKQCSTKEQVHHNRPRTSPDPIHTLILTICTRLVYSRIRHRHKYNMFFYYLVCITIKCFLAPSNPQMIARGHGSLTIYE